MNRTIRIESGSVETRIVEWYSEADPTANDPEFGLADPAAGETGDDVSTWVAGTWSTSWAADTGYIDAVTPSLGGGGAQLGLTEREPRVLWGRVGVVIKEVARVTVG